MSSTEQDAGEIRGRVDAKCEVYVRPLIFFAGAVAEASDGGPGDAPVMMGQVQETGAQANAFRE